jgi:hypothetical protein
MSARIDQITADLERALGLPEETIAFDSGPRGSRGWVCVPADVAERLILDHYGTCDHGAQEVTTCGACGRSWCDACDPAHGPLCPWCAGRGWSTAPRASS